MRKHFYLLAVVTCGWISMLTTVGTGHPQGGQAPAPAPPTTPAQQATAPATGQRGFVPRNRERLRDVPDSLFCVSRQSCATERAIARCNSGPVA